MPQFMPTQMANCTDENGKPTEECLAKGKCTLACPQHFSAKNSSQEMRADVYRRVPGAPMIAPLTSGHQINDNS